MVSMLYTVEILCCTHATYKPMLSQFLKMKNCGQHSHAFLLLYWVGQKSCSDFSIRCYGKLDRIFWPTQYHSLLVFLLRLWLFLLTFFLLYRCLKYWFSPVFFPQFSFLSSWKKKLISGASASIKCWILLNLCLQMKLDLSTLLHCVS